MSPGPHRLRETQSGAECSCGRVFSVWECKRRPGWSASRDFARTLTLVLATARRHVEAANRKVST